MDDFGNNFFELGGDYGGGQRGIHHHNHVVVADGVDVAVGKERIKNGVVVDPIFYFYEDSPP